MEHTYFDLNMFAAHIGLSKQRRETKSYTILANMADNNAGSLLYRWRHTFSICAGERYGTRNTYLHSFENKQGEPKMYTFDMI